ncbi:hypothetical protein PN36_15865 [Candidatus Thiomargarita nelsonii]|uniref:Uncharacterized protein n=1 Tax=Candidatus Thiomargarita nelsonii TaxID=1003181 RepID=A0A0A6PPK2_9GAMM|nr:hypothetical protein PN36_15865 [Candidatus Thiomargarita nelsonii]
MCLTNYIESKSFDEIVQATFDELRAMSHSELRAEIEKRKKSDFARIFSETGEIADRKKCERDNLTHYEPSNSY